MQGFKNTLLIIIGAGLFSFSLNYLNIPNGLYEGGLTGINLILFYVFGLKPSVMNILINIPLFLLGWKLLGKRTLYFSILGTVSVTVWLAIFEQIPLVIDLKGDLLMVSMSTGILMGIGLGIIFRSGGTTGGSDIIARIGHAYTPYSIGQVMLTFDALVLTLTAIVSKDLRIVLYTLLAVVIVSKVIDLITDGSYGSKGVMIISQKSMEIATAIDAQIERGVTFIKAQGFYSKQNINMVYSVVYKGQIPELKALIHQIDPHAFITITDAHEVLGEGFTLDENKQPLER